MKKIIILFLVIFPLVVFSQGSIKNEISWTSLENAQISAKKYNRNILIYFYKKDCPYCEKMKKNTLSDPNVISIINSNFFPVKLDSRLKDTIIYNGKIYGNQQPEDHGYTWRHDFYAEVAAFTQNGSSKLTTPSVVIFNSDFKKISSMPGNQPKELFERRLNKILNKS